MKDFTTEELRVLVKALRRRLNPHDYDESDMAEDLADRAELELEERRG